MKLFNKVQELFKKVSGFVLPSEQAAKTSLLQVTDLPTWRELLARRDGFPDRYLAYFQPDPLPDMQGLLGREVELSRLNEVLERWEGGLSCSVALVGSEGSGKTSLLNGFAELAGQRCPVLFSQFPRRITCSGDLLAFLADCFVVETPFQNIQEAINFILSRPRQVIILEHGHNLTLRLVGCREVLDDFYRLLLETRQHWLWIVSFRKYPWDRLVMTSKIQHYFTHQIDTLYQDESHLQQIIEGRHALSGLGLEFLPTADEEKSPEALAKDYFKALFAVTRGNIVAALYYWLVSLDEDCSDQTIRIKPLGSVEVDYLRSLERPYHLTLAEVVWHGGLSCSEHQRIFFNSPQASRLQLDYLVNLSLLVTDGLDEEGLPGRYRLNPVCYKPVVALLESLHLIY